MNQQPQVKYRHDYRALDYTISDIALDFVLDAQKTHVTAVSQVVRQGEAGAPLKLDGEGLTLLSLTVDGQAWPHYQVEDDGLVLTHLPDAFTLSIVTRSTPPPTARWRDYTNLVLRFVPSVKRKGSATSPIIWIAPMYWRALPRVSPPIRFAILIYFPTAIASHRAPWMMVETGLSGRIRSRNRAICSRWWRGTSMCSATALPPVPGAKWPWSCMSIAAISIVRAGR